MEHISIHALREEGDGAPHPAGARTQHFYPRPPRGGRRSRNSSFGKSKVFLSTPSARRATTRGLRRSCRGPISIHALREEGDAYTAECMEALKVFLSTPSARRATYARRRRADGYVISIHALREEGGTALCELDAALNKISIHALREEGDQHLLSCTLQHVIFLSTPSARRATSVLDTSVTATVFLSTPSARRATLRRALPDDLRRGISIHALREEGDKPTVNGTRHTDRFLSTPSARRATVGNDAQAQDIEISIHALREEGDVIFCFNSASAC